MEKSIRELQNIATLQVCDILNIYGERINFDFFCPECYLKHGIVSNHNVSIETSQTMFYCPLYKCRAVYSVKVASFKKTKQDLNVLKINVSKIGAYGTIN